MFSRHAGVTLVELVIYMVIAVTLAASVLLAYQPNAINARYQAEQLKASLRHMQMLAMTWGVTLRMSTAGGNYSVACVGSSTGSCAASAAPPCANAIRDPATGNPFCIVLQNATLSSMPATFDLDSLGRPRDSAGVLLGSDTGFTLGGGGASYTLTVRQLTGFVSLP